jgi:hypothetical protein
VDDSYSAKRIVGGVVMAVGGILLADNLGYIAIRVEDLWPLILIAIGLIMLWNRTTGSWGRSGNVGYDTWNWRHRGRRWADPVSSGGSFSSNTLHEYAVFGGSRRVVTDQDFKGGRIACVFGGVNLDLTGAAMVNNTAVIELATVYGGATIRIPTSWNLEVRGAGIFGGFADHTVHPPNTPDMKRLIIRGAAVFGGVTFKN